MSNGEIVGAVTLAFIGLKLANVIDWSWWWVTSPLWLYLFFVALLVVVLGLMD